ncbi:hypothetical protein TWF281_002875 [Arthrobotrys megalospora]
MEQISVLTIPPELHIAIFAFLEISDLSRLIQTCKYFHRTASHYLRRRIDGQTIQAISEFQGGSGRKPPETVSVERAPFIQDDYFDYRFALGLDFTAVDAGNGVSTRRSIHDINVFLELVGMGARAEGMSIKDGALYMSKPVSKDQSFCALFRALRDFSYSRPASEFSITSLTGQLSATRTSQLFDTHKLTKLSLSFKQVDWHGRENPEPSPRTLDDIKSLTELFQKSPNLEVLVLNPVMEITEFQPLPENVPALEELTKSFLALKKVHTLDVRVYLFHPSYFIPVPEGVKVLSFYHVNLYSKAWWTQFSKFPFKNVEHLDVFPSEDEFGYIFARDDYQTEFDRDGTARTAEEIAMKGYKLGDVEMRGLKTFKFADTDKLFLPRDLNWCILKRNEGLGEDVKRALIQKSGEQLDEAIEGGRRQSM